MTVANHRAKKLARTHALVAVLTFEAPLSLIIHVCLNYVHQGCQMFYRGKVHMYSQIGPN